jgi:hypothetical protein
MTKMPPIHIVFGDYQGELDVKPGEKVIFIGDCAQYTGPVGDEIVQHREHLCRSQPEAPARSGRGEHLRQDVRRPAPSCALLKDKNHVIRIDGLPGERRRAGAHAHQAGAPQEPPTWTPSRPCPS